MGIRFWSMFRVQVDTQDIGGRLRPRTEAKTRRCIRIDLNIFAISQNDRMEPSRQVQIVPP